MLIPCQPSVVVNRHMRQAPSQSLGQTVLVEGDDESRPHEDAGDDLCCCRGQEKLLAVLGVVVGSHEQGKGWGWGG